MIRAGPQRCWEGVPHFTVSASFRLQSVNHLGFLLLPDRLSVTHKHLIKKIKFQLLSHSSSRGPFPRLPLGGQGDSSLPQGLSGELQAAPGSTLSAAKGCLCYSFPERTASLSSWKNSWPCLPSTPFLCRLSQMNRHGQRPQVGCPCASPGVSDGTLWGG